jgi:hypothetical protein
LVETLQRIAVHGKLWDLFGCCTLNNYLHVIARAFMRNPVCPVFRLKKFFDLFAAMTIMDLRSIVKKGICDELDTLVQDDGAAPCDP